MKYTYDGNRKLGALIPLEAEDKTKKEKDISQVVINLVKASRGESSWTKRDIAVLRASALCEISHYYQALKASQTAHDQVALLKELKSEREAIALEIMKGMTVEKAFKKCCEELNSEALRPFIGK